MWNFCKHQVTSLHIKEALYALVRLLQQSHKKQGTISTKEIDVGHALYTFHIEKMNQRNDQTRTGGNGDRISIAFLLVLIELNPISPQEDSMRNHKVFLKMPQIS